MIKNLTISFVAFLLSTFPLSGQIGVTHTSLESKVAEADLIVRARTLEIATGMEDDGCLWLHITLEVKETLKGTAGKIITFTRETYGADKRWEQLVESGEEQLFFLVNSDRPFPGENPKGPK